MSFLCLARYSFIGCVPVGNRLTARRSHRDQFNYDVVSQGRWRPLNLSFNCSSGLSSLTKTVSVSDIRDTSDKAARRTGFYWNRIHKFGLAYIEIRNEKWSSAESWKKIQFTCAPEWGTCGETHPAGVRVLWTSWSQFVLCREGWGSIENLKFSILRLTILHYIYPNARFSFHIFLFTLKSAYYYCRFCPLSGG